MATVLIVDDEVVNRRMLKLLLHTHGDYRIVEAGSGLQALGLLDAEDPDLVITDALMPDLDGYELTRAIRSRSTGGDLPVLIFSANYSEAEMNRVARACGANQVMAKPAEPDALFAAVDNLLTGAREPAAVRAEEDFATEHRRTVSNKLVHTTHRLHLTEAQLRTLAEAAPVGIVLTDATGKSIFTNATLAQVTGLAPADLGGRGWLACLPETARSMIDALASGASTGEAEVDQWPVTGPHGSPRWLTASARALRDGDDQHAGLIVIINDVTAAVEATKRQEAEARRLILERAERASERLASLRRMAGGVAHDFNNALASVLAYVEFLQDAITEASTAMPTGLGQQLLTDLDHLAESAGRMRDLTKALLRFGSRLSVTPPPLDLNRTISVDLEALRQRLPAGVDLAVDLGAGLPPALASPENVTEILHNLTSNAIDAMRGAGVMSVTTRAVDIPASQNPAGIRPDLPLGINPGRYLRLTVADTGVGMAEDVREHAVEPFFTTHSIATHSGLGLSTAYGAAAQVGGELAIVSKPDQGTQVHAYFPVASAAQPARPTEASLPGSTQTRTVLVVDDDPDVLTVVGRFLTRSGYQVLSAPDWSAALELADHHPQSIDYLLTGVVMPHMLGSELARRLLLQRPHTRVLYMSGYADPLIEDEGPTDRPVLIKPFTRAQLLAALDRLDPTAISAGRPAAKTTSPSPSPHTTGPPDDNR